MTQKFQLVHGEAGSKLQVFPDNYFQCGVTSPPYWQQRDYNERNQMGREETPEEYVANLVKIMREVKRVLRPDGIFWLNIGDTYAQKKIGNIKPRDLVGIPWLVAFALRDDGWYLRDDIIWAKTNPQPESVKNRTIRSHENIFMLTKSPNYYYDNEAIQEPQKEISIKRAFSVNKVASRKDFKNPNYKISGEAQDRTYKKMRAEVEAGKEMMRNKWSIWTGSSSNYKGKHFATFPEWLVKPCILAGVSQKGCCPKCKKPWQKKRWEADCECGEQSREECWVLDPFCGTSTTGVVSLKYRANFVGIDVSEKYVKISRQRLEEIDPIYIEEISQT